VAKTIKGFFFYGFAALVCVAFFSNSARAATISYGDFDDIVSGGTITYIGVEESSGTDPVPLYGTPSISINELSFTPNLVATASGGGIDVTDGLLSFDLEVEPGHAIVGLEISEFGAYSLLGSGTDTTQALIAAIGFLTITEVDGVPISPFTVTDSFSLSFDLVADGPVALAPWTEGLSFDLSAALAAEGFSASSGVTAAEFVMNNQAVAFSEAGTLSFIDKKGLDITVETVVPEPATLMLAVLAFGSIGLAAGRRRG